MCVNGDDILFWSYNKDHYETWKEVTKQCGLKFSLGKNYSHRNVAIINSQLFFFSERRRGQRTDKDGNIHVHCPHNMFSMGLNIEPRLLFRNERTLNSRLICGGQRSVAVCGGKLNYQSIGDYDAILLQVLAEELDNNNISPVTYCGGKLTTQQRTTLTRTYNNRSTLEKVIFIQQCQQGDQSEKAANFEEYCKWRNTIEQRGEKLINMLQGDAGERSRPAMREAVKIAFNNVQHAKLERFRLWGLKGADKDVPFYIPQCLGGLGLFPPVDHKYTLEDYIEIATLEGRPDSAEKWVNGQKPSLPMPTFMKAVSHELTCHKDLLQIQPEFKEIEDIGFLRFLGMEDGFWEHSFLSGHLHKTNMITDVEDAGQALMYAQHRTRAFRRERLMREKLAQIKRGVQLNMWKEAKVDGKKRVVAVEGEDCFEKIDFKSVSIYRMFRPSPKYE